MAVDTVVVGRKVETRATAQKSGKSVVLGAEWPVTLEARGANGIASITVPAKVRLTAAQTTALFADIGEEVPTVA